MGSYIVVCVLSIFRLLNVIIIIIDLTSEKIGLSAIGRLDQHVALNPYWVPTQKVGYETSDQPEPENIIPR